MLLSTLLLIVSLVWQAVEKKTCSDISAYCAKNVQPLFSSNMRSGNRIEFKEKVDGK